MTREADQAAAAIATSRTAATAGGESPTEPPAIQIKMPNSNPAPQPGMRAPAQSETLAGVAQLLNDLLARLDESGGRHGEALGGLKESAKILSGRTEASILAEHNDAVGAAHQLQNDIPPAFENGTGHIDRSNDELPRRDFDNVRLARNLSAIAEELQRSFTAREPIKDLGVLSQKMDALTRRLDIALDASNDIAALEKIESQLSALTASFSETRQIHTKVDAIEGHLLDLVRSAENSGTANQSAGDDGRLAAIEQALIDLHDSARNTDSRTLSALQAMSEVLHSLASHAGGKEKVEPLVGEFEAAEREAEIKPDPRPQADADYEADGDFIAPPRSTAGAATAQTPAEPGSKRPTSAYGSLPGAEAEVSATSTVQSDKRRPALITAAVLLLIISAGLLYSRLSPQPESQPVVESPLSRSGTEIPR